MSEEVSYTVNQDDYAVDDVQPPVTEAEDLYREECADVKLYRDRALRATQQARWLQCITIILFALQTIGVLVIAWRLR